MRRLLLLPVLALLVLSLPTSPAHADDTYTPSVPTQCHISVPSAVVGGRVVLRVVVSASSNVEPTGTVVVTVTRSGAARAVRAARSAPWTTTVRYDGSALRIVGPRLSRGDHVATVRFTPDEGVFLGCRDSVRFRVGGHGGGDVGGEEAALPDTGGPRLLVLLAGAGLLAAGAGLVGGSRRFRA